jgi:ribosomal protein S18 acetylase RimI-like enzyme
MNPHHAAAGIEQSPKEAEGRVLAKLEAAQILEAEGTPIGMFKVVRGSEEWRIMQIQLLPAYQRRGIGTAVLGRILAEASANRVPVTLSVLKANHAIRLYKRVGFTIVSEDELAFHMCRYGG